MHIAAFGEHVAACAEGGWTSLYSATYEGHVAAITILLAAGADLNLRNEDGKLPVDFIKEDSLLYKSSEWRRLNDARSNNQ